MKLVQLACAAASMATGTLAFVDCLTEYNGYIYNFEGTYKSAGRSFTLDNGDKIVVAVCGKVTDKVDTARCDDDFGACVQTTNGGRLNFETIGKVSTGFNSWSTNGLILKYSGESGSNQVVETTFKCNSQAPLQGTVTGMTRTDGRVRAFIDSPCACINIDDSTNCKPVPVGPSPDAVVNPISFGSVMIILFFVGFMVYLIAGFIYFRFVQGVPDAFPPHKAFWLDLPYLVRDGVYFIRSKVCGGARSSPLPQAKLFEEGDKGAYETF